MTVRPSPSVPAHYPNAKWHEKQAEYDEWWSHFNGDWLQSRVGSDDQLEYPLQLNPFNLPCLLHAGFLFGEVGDGDPVLVKTVVEPWNRDSPDTKREEATIMTDFVNRVWEENSGRALQQESGIVSQVLGGCVFGTAFDPDMEKQGMLGVRIDHVLPDYFYPVPAHNQYWRLLEAIVCYEISGIQAAAYGADVPEEEQTAIYQERWQRDAYEITVGGQMAMWKDHNLSGTPIGLSPPYVYIPHIRVGEFYGKSLLEDKLEIAKEINKRFADVGDIVSVNASQLPYIVGAQNISIRRLGGNMVALDLGQGTPGFDEPKLVYPASGSSQVNKSTVDWALELLYKARTEVYTPPVLYGVDEGSQRSGLTLALRALPLLVHIREERTYYTSGMNEIARQILHIGAAKGLGGITEEMLKDIRIYQEWAPIMPRDQDQLVNEMILRLNAGLIDPETAMEKLGDIRDTDTTMNLVREWMEQQAQWQSQGNPFGGTGMDGEQAGLSRPSEPSPNINKEE